MTGEDVKRSGEERTKAESKVKYVAFAVVKRLGISGIISLSLVLDQ